MVERPKPTVAVTLVTEPGVAVADAAELDDVPMPLVATTLKV
jgi:hypothetical protein